MIKNKTLNTKQEAILNRLVGEVIKETNGRANPIITREVLIELLNGK